MKRADLRPYAGQIQAPTLCLVGDEDGSTPVALVRETSELIPGSRFEIIEGAGHLPNVEKPKIVAELVAEHAKTGGLLSASALVADCREPAAQKKAVEC